MLQCGVLGAAHLPILFGVLFSINLGATYILAVVKSDVEPIFPYVSAAGDHRPESCLFGLLLNLSSVVSLVVVYLRYSLITVLVHDSDPDPLLGSLNFISLIFGMLGGFAMMIIANFQETALITVHLSAACLCFGSGCLYMMLQSWITVRMYPLYTNRRIGIIRSCITVVSTVSFIMAVSFGIYAAHEFHRYYPDLPTPRPWNRKYWQPGYNYHVVSAIAEWIMAISHVFFIVSYSRDFEKLRVSLYIESLVTHLDHSPILRSFNDLANM
ncbi:hypothetical protein RB195_021866 [Necator americanus]|uniref:CWH43-like N-terminal domain-containing protein n=2 Tax=Necator americanus TaxID=51031 RepID=A0ABR1ED15_NECAM